MHLPFFSGIISFKWSDKSAIHMLILIRYMHLWVYLYNKDFTQHEQLINCNFILNDKLDLWHYSDLLYLNAKELLTVEFAMHSMRFPPNYPFVAF